MGTWLMQDGVLLADNMVTSSIFLTHVTEKHTLTASLIDADTSVSALSIDLEASDDGRGVTDADAKWYSLNTHAFDGGEIIALRAMWWIVSKPVKRVRMKVTASTGEGAGDLLTMRYTQGSQ